MDLWSRLIGGVDAAHVAQTSSPSEQRLARLKQIDNDLAACCEPGPKPRPSLLARAQALSKSLVNLLDDDIRSAAPHFCVDFLLSHSSFRSVVLLAISFQDKAINEAAISLLNGLVESDEDNDLMGSSSFATELMRYVDELSGLTFFQDDSDIQSQVLEMLFNVSSKIKLNKDLLSAWYGHGIIQDQVELDASSGNSAVTYSSHSDFPLCFHLVEHVYRDVSGDFARTGLLYIVELTSYCKALERWIVVSDVFTLLASGLGALYSQLSRKLTLEHAPGELPTIAALSSGSGRQTSRPGVDSLYSEDTQSRLNMFISNLVFWQDLLQNCSSDVVKRRILACFQSLFLDQILYPSILQSSDRDGGSSVAVLTYLWKILEAIDQPDLVRLILEYLLAITEHPDVLDPGLENRPNGTISETQHLASSFFSVVDLCLGSLKSTKMESNTAALRLVDVIIRKHHRYAFSTLLKTNHIKTDKITRLISSVPQDVTQYLQTAADLAGCAGMDDSYEMCLKDAFAMIECHNCRQKDTVFDEEQEYLHDSYTRFEEDNLHSIRSDDPVFGALRGLLDSFLTNDVETNLCLTSTITNVAACPYTRLEDFIVGANRPNTSSSELDQANVETNSPRFKGSDQDDSEEYRYQRFIDSAREHKHLQKADAPVYSSIQKLLNRLRALEHDIPDIFTLVEKRKEALQSSLSFEDPTQSTLSAQAARRFSTYSQQIEQTMTTPRKGLGSPQISPRKQRPAPATPASRTVTPMSSYTSLRTKSPSPSRRGSLVASALTPLARLFGGVRRLSNSPKPLSPRPSLLFGRGDTPTSLALSESMSTPQKSSNYLISFLGDEDVVVRDRSQSGDATEPPSGETGEGEGINDDEDSETTTKEVSLDLILTNAVILQEFAIELAAVIQVRGSFIKWEINFP